MFGCPCLLRERERKGKDRAGKERKGEDGSNT